MTYGYDTADRLTSKTYPDSIVDTFTPDAVGRTISGVSHRYDTTITRTYDGLGRLATEALTVPVAMTQESHSITYGYDDNDRLTSLTYPDGSMVTRTYTTRDQLLTVSRASQSIAQYGYGDGGQQIRATLGNGLVET